MYETDNFGITQILIVIGSWNFHTPDLFVGGTFATGKSADNCY